MVEFSTVPEPTTIDPFLSDVSDTQYDPYPGVLEEVKRATQHAKNAGREKPLPAAQAYYGYYPRKRRSDRYYLIYTPGGIQIFRVPQSVLGHNILGRAWMGTNRIEILETLHGQEFEEVKLHEMNHLFYPFLNELQIRQKTKYELPFEARFH